MPINLSFKLRTIYDKSPLGTLIKEQLNDSLGNSLSGDGSLRFLISSDIYSSVYRFKFDTGAFMSLFPYSAFIELKPEKFVRYTLFGVQHLPECGVECAVTKCSLKLLDSNNEESPVFESWIAFPLGAKVPSLLGMKNILDSHKHIWNPLESTLEILF